MTPKQILQVIEAEGLKEMSGTSPLACLNAMLHSNSRGGDGLFYKLPGRISLFTLKKDALQWSRNLSVPEGEELEDTADAESCESNEASTVSGDNDVSLDDTSSNASCSTESQSKGHATTRESYRTTSQTTKQKKKTGVMLPRVVLTPLKVNGAHMESASGFTGRHADGESSSTSSSSSSSLALCKATLRSRTEINRDPPQLLRGIRKPTAGQMKRNRGEDIDFETPGSILVNTNLRALINSRTFNALPSHFQQQLLYLLPEVDRQVGADGLMRLSGSALNNEFFTHAAQSWRERLADGEFTHEMQVRIRQEMEKEKRVEQWKEKFFEDYYGQKLGLTQEESQEQNLVQEDAENRTGLSVKGEAREARLPRGPSTRQRDGHFKKRTRADLRCRARRSLYKLRDPEQTEASKETSSSVGPDSSLHKETKPEIDLKKDDPTSPSAAVLKPESSESHLSPETSKSHSKSEDPSLAAANRIPTLPQENSARESKDQKRKCFEEAASASFPEKKPRLEDRQSFRNTIESVHPEKPQPTKEEPKVPPIRIQLSRIKPPWVVKGQPAYQICPRIIPNTESSSRGRTGARTLADIKARALQARAQREAATAAIGGGGGPGGGRSTDEGGGGRESSGRTEHRRSKRTHGKRSSDLQRTQLLSSLHLNGEKADDSEVAAQEADVNSFLSSRQDSLSSKSEGTGLLECTSSGEAQPGDGSPKGQLCDALTGSSLDNATSERQEESPEQLPCDPRTETPPCVASQERPSPKLKCVVPPVNGLSCSRVQGAVVGPTGDRVVSEPKDVGAPALQLDYRSDRKENSSCCPALLPELSSGGKERHEPEMVSRFRFNGSETILEKSVADSDNSKTVTAGVEKAVPALYDFSHLQAEKESDGKLSNEEQSTESLGKHSLHDDFISQNRIDTSEKLVQLRERCPRTEPENAHQPLRETQELKTSGDDEIQSTHSETTDTASDFEGDIADENLEMDICFRSVSCREVAGKDSSCHSSAERCGRIRSKEADGLAYAVDFPAVAVRSTAPPSQRWGPHAPLPQKPERPTGSARPVSSVETNNPLVMQLLKGNLPLEEVLPVSHSNVKLETTQPPLDKQSESLPLQMERGNNCYFGKESSPDVGIKTSALSRSDDFHSMRSSTDPQEKCRSGAALPRAEDAEDQSIPEKHSKAGATLSCQDQLANVASASQKPEDVGPRERTFSSCSFEEQKELPKVHQVPQHNPSTSVITNKSPEKLNASTDPRFLSPAVTSLGPNQTEGTSVSKNYVGVQGKKLFGSGFPSNPSVRLHHSRALDQASAMGTLSPSKQIPQNKSCASGEGMVAPREEWTSKQPPNTPGGIKNENVLACGSSAKSNAENRNDAQNPVEPSEHLQSVPLVMDLPFFKFSKESGKGHNHPLEPSSIPSQLNIKQAFYGKLSKLQLNSTSFNYSSNTPAFPRSLAGSMMQLTHKANFAANHNTSLSVQMFADSSSVDEISFKCSCSLKAMIMCKGCGAFCHDDCIGPSKLCVLCLVVR
ncbi:PREDICTED: putative Polycomb group protein ASXL1 isoform X1 [Calidris pugnax]|uniref:putative Polycomb group protein ASXL1 isoform X1 n=2 Tax=Calidris pugnax TaxID=198806 RepID=UPI00071DBFD5|nr:PREDICTED: putative Polycomb group protein ASXL1 isoform X1 [Calidris pugnax]XP_014812337.1 PREDICTED: putative Polycomb group protein ASXL1 isoform X1 [Calidris pugnax]